MAREKETSVYEYTSVVNPQDTEDISVTATRMKNKQWESSVKTVQKRHRYSALKMDGTPSAWGPRFVPIRKVFRDIETLTRDMSNTQVLYPDTRRRRVPGFWSPPNPRVSSQARSRHGFCPSGLYPPSTRVSTIRGASLVEVYPGEYPSQTGTWIILRVKPEPVAGNPCFQTKSNGFNDYSVNPGTFGQAVLVHGHQGVPQAEDRAYYNLMSKREL